MFFQKYAQYYDLLYQDKDYKSEAEYVVSLINKFHPKAQKILEFGSGTGVHGRIFSDLGFTVSGIEKSHAMMEFGNQNAKLSNEKGQFTCVYGDCTETFINDDFDSVVSLFHVLNYQITDEKVGAMFKNAHRQISQGGIFIFDFWFAPAVWYQRPKLRIKKIENEKFRITRIAEPVCYEDANLVDINYITYIENLLDNSIRKIEESHKIRAFSLNEINEFSRATGFEVLTSEEWMTKANPSKETWGVCTVLRRV